MRVYGRKSRKGEALYWVAIGLVPLTILSSGHGRLQHFLTGCAAAIFAVALAEIVRWRRSCVR
jgi:hypothetical protein